MSPFDSVFVLSTQLNQMIWILQPDPGIDLDNLQVIK